MTSIVRLTKAEAAPANAVANKAAKAAAKAALQAAEGVVVAGGESAAAAAAPGPEARAGAPPAPAASPLPAAPAAPPLLAGPAVPQPPPAAAPAAPSARDRAYLEARVVIMGELLGWVMTDGQQTYGDSRWLLMCDAGPRGLLPRCHLPWQHTGTVTFATWWEILQFDGLVYMLRGVFAVRRLIILRNLFAVVRLACRGESVLGQPARVPMGLDARAVRAVIAFEDITPVVMHRHSLHVIIHLV